MIQRRLLSIVLVLLFAFAQQQALLHSYAHLAVNAPHNAANIGIGQATPNSDQDSGTHSELCSKCIAFAGLGNAISQHAQAFVAAQTAFIPFVFTVTLFRSNSVTHYQSRAPPHFFQA